MHRATTSVAVLAALCLAGCHPANQPGAKSPTAAQSPPLAVAAGIVDQDGGLVRINAPRDGLLTAVFAQEGERVASGQILATMDTRQASLNLRAAQAEAAVKAAQVQIVRARLEGALRDAGRLERLSAQDAATTEDADRARTAARVARAELEEAVQAARASAASAKVTAYAVDTGGIRAPAVGRILRRTATVGASVGSATPLFTMETDAPRIVRAEVDEAFADKVRPGMRAAVSREFDDGQSYPARVLRVSDIFGSPTLNDDTTARSDTRVVAVVVALDGRPRLKFGQRVLVRFGP